MIRNDWTLIEVKDIYLTPLLDLIFKAAEIHRHWNKVEEIQMNHLISIKTGGCVEDCAYCSQAARYSTGIEIHSLLSVKEVVTRAKGAKEKGVSRICLGAAWREIRNNRDFDQVLEMVTEIHSLGLEVCCTLGMLNFEQAKKLKNAGCYAYNHNIDTSPEFYSKIISTRTFQNRLDTLKVVGEVGLSICCGGIIGLGETSEDRMKLIHTLATLPVQPDSIPINALVPIKGTPLGDQTPASIDEMLRMIATIRILMPFVMIRISAGRESMDMAGQVLCFLAGANSIFVGDKLLTASNCNWDDDINMFKTLGLLAKKPFQKKSIIKEEPGKNGIYDETF